MNRFNKRNRADSQGSAFYNIPTAESAINKLEVNPFIQRNSINLTYRGVN